VNVLLGLVVLLVITAVTVTAMLGMVRSG